MSARAKLVGKHLAGTVSHPAFFCNAERHVANERVRIPSRANDRAESRPTPKAGHRDERLEAELGDGRDERRLHRLARLDIPRIAELPERDERHLAHAILAVRCRPDESGHRLSGASVRESESGVGAHFDRGVGFEGPFQRRDHVRARRARGDPREILERRCANTTGSIRRVAERRGERSRKRRQSEQGEALRPGSIVHLTRKRAAQPLTPEL